MINNADNYFVHFDHQWQTFFFFFFFFLYQHIYHPSTPSININIIGSNLECGPLSKLITIELQYYWQQKIIIPSCNRKITSSIIVSPPIPPPTTIDAFSNCTINFTTHITTGKRSPIVICSRPHHTTSCCHTIFYHHIYLLPWSHRKLHNIQLHWIHKHKDFCLLPVINGISGIILRILLFWAARRHQK